MCTFSALGSRWHLAVSTLQLDKLHQLYVVGQRGHIQKFSNYYNVTRVNRQPVGLCWRFAVGAGRRR